MQLPDDAPLALFVEDPGAPMLDDIHRYNARAVDKIVIPGGLHMSQVARLRERWSHCDFVIAPGATRGARALMTDNRARVLVNTTPGSRSEFFLRLASNVLPRGIHVVCDWLGGTVETKLVVAARVPALIHNLHQPTTGPSSYETSGRARRRVLTIGKNQHDGWEGVWRVADLLRGICRSVVTLGTSRYTALLGADLHINAERVPAREIVSAIRAVSHTCAEWLVAEGRYALGHPHDGPVALGVTRAVAPTHVVYCLTSESAESAALRLGKTVRTLADIGHQVEVMGFAYPESGMYDGVDPCALRSAVERHAPDINPQCARVLLGVDDVRAALDRAP